ncbi:alkaline phosphatase family protein [Pseudomonas sp. NA-150]|uniref:alkaline phosphatase family protein n=1 Tax=Pseudomonas sp. NA-150 TaxID=3367525 RepID=UPI0037C796A5
MSSLFRKTTQGLCLLLIASLASAGDETAAQIDYSANKVLLIGVDGMQYEKLLEAIKDGDAPTLARFFTAKSYTGGIVGTSTQQTTFSGPGWATILTGAWIDRHQVHGNDSLLRNKADSLFKLIKSSAPTRQTASIVSWDTINDNLADDIHNGYINRALQCHDDDRCVANAVGQLLKTSGSDFIFAHFDEPDMTGHAKGFSPEYQAAIQQVDGYISGIMSALATRPVEEDWLVIVAPDHGRLLPSGQTHGGQTLSEKTTFIALNKPANPQLSQPIVDPMNPGFDGLYGDASQADIAPTALHHLGITHAPAAYRIDGQPLLGPTGVRQLTVYANNQERRVTLQWRNEAPSGKPITIYRDGQKLVELTDRQAEYVDTELQSFGTGPKDINYVVEMDDVPIARLVRIDLPPL